MGAKYSNWALYEGPIYMGANSSWEVIWTLLAVILCVVAVISGSRHEHASYRRMKTGKKR